MTEPPLLPKTVPVPEGATEVVTECVEPPAAEGEYRSNYGFAVPSSWKPVSRSSAGSGSALSSHIKLGFDREITATSSSGDDTHVTIKFEELGTVTVGVRGRVQGSAPDRSTPMPTSDRSDAVTQSIVVTVSHDAKEGPLSEARVKAIPSSFALGSCIRDSVHQDLELQYQADLNGDGKVTPLQDVLDGLDESQAAG